MKCRGCNKVNNNNIKGWGINVDRPMYIKHITCKICNEQGTYLICGHCLRIHIENICEPCQLNTKINTIFEL